MPSLLDHGLAGLLVIAVPVYAAVFGWPRLRAGIGGLAIVTSAVYLFGDSLLPVVLLRVHLAIAGGLTATALSRPSDK